MDTRQQKNKKVSSDEWYTPKWIIDALGEFDLDPCSPTNRPFDTAKVHYSKSEPFFGSCLVAWGKHNDDVLRQCGIEGKYVKLNEK